MTKKSKKVKLLKGEKMMYALLVFLLLAIPIFNVFTSSLLSETNNEVENIKDLAKVIHYQFAEVTKDRKETNE